MLRNQFDKDHKVLWWKIMEIMKTDNSGLTHSSGAVVAEESIICAMLMGRIINCQNVFLRDREAGRRSFRHLASFQQIPHLLAELRGVHYFIVTVMLQKSGDP
jgi:hypothetical protein